MASWWAGPGSWFVSMIAMSSTRPGGGPILPVFDLCSVCKAVGHTCAPLSSMRQMPCGGAEGTCRSSEDPVVPLSGRVKWKSLSSVWPIATPWTIQSLNSLGQNTGVGRLSLLQEIFLTQELNPGLLHCRQIPYRLSHQRSPSGRGFGETQVAEEKLNHPWSICVPGSWEDPPWSILFPCLFICFPFKKKSSGFLRMMNFSCLFKIASIWSKHVSSMAALQGTCICGPWTGVSGSHGCWVQGYTNLNPFLPRSGADFNGPPWRVDSDSQENLNTILWSQKPAWCLGSQHTLMEVAQIWATNNY